MKLKKLLEKNTVVVLSASAARPGIARCLRRHRLSRDYFAYLDGAMSLEAAIAAMKLNTWHFAKRQITWFKKDASVRWVQNLADAETLVAEFLKE